MNLNNVGNLLLGYGRLLLFSSRGLKKTWIKPKNEPLKHSHLRPWTEPLVEGNVLALDGQKAVYPFEASPLHAVCKLRPLHFRPWTEKKVATSLGLGKRVPLHKMVIVANTPENNEKLKVVKHLIRIIPVRFPQGLPESDADLGNSRLLPNGEFVITKTLQHVGVTTTEMEEYNKKWVLDKTTRNRILGLKIIKRRRNIENFPTAYEYKRNQDGKEYRYTKDLQENRDRDDVDVNGPLVLHDPKFRGRKAPKSARAKEHAFDEGFVDFI